MSTIIRLPRFAVAGLVLLLFLVALPAAPAHAAGTITVNSTEDDAGDTFEICSLREAIQSANVNINIDGCTRTGTPPYTIVVPAGVYELTSAGADPDNNEFGDLDILVPMTIQGAGAGETIVQAGPFPGAGIDRVMHVLALGPGVVTIEGLTLRYGRVNATGAQGGGILHAGTAILNIVDSVITQNELIGTGIRGVGVANAGGGTLNIMGSEISANRAITDDTGGGAGVANLDGPLNINATAIVNNEAVGGGVGGLIHQETTDPAVIRSTLIADNRADTDGSGAAFVGPTLIVNSTISGNRTNGSYAGVFMVLNTLNLVNVTITNNTADQDNDGTGDGGGLVSLVGAVVNVRNTIIAGNFDTPDNAGSGDIFPDVEGVFFSQGNNLIGNNAGLNLLSGTPFTDGVNGDIVGTPAAPLDPLLGSLADNGGPTLTHLLLPGSPAIDAGDPGACLDGTLTDSVDQRGVTRPIDGDRVGEAICDIGAVEVEFVGQLFLPLVVR